jgi:hypothetical protein
VRADGERGKSKLAAAVAVELALEWTAGGGCPHVISLLFAFISYSFVDAPCRYFLLIAFRS